MRLNFEVYPSDQLALDAIPNSWRLTITCTSGALEPTLDLYRSLGPSHTPHIAATLLTSEAHAQAVGGSISPKVFLIGGDHAAVKGPFDRSAPLIPYFAHCEQIGVGGYPQGHTSYAYETLGDEILLEKQGLGATYIATQMCFDPQALIDWVTRIRNAGVTLPVVCGVAAPLNVASLTRFAVNCGVTHSLNFLQKMSTRDVAKMIRRYDPVPLMEEVRDHVDGFHVFTFNAIKTTRAWVERVSWLQTITP